MSPLFAVGGGDIVKETPAPNLDSATEFSISYIYRSLICKLILVLRFPKLEECEWLEECDSWLWFAAKFKMHLLRILKKFTGSSEISMHGSFFREFYRSMIDLLSKLPKLKKNSGNFHQGEFRNY